MIHQEINSSYKKTEFLYQKSFDIRIYFIPYSKLNIKIDFLIYQNYETPFKYILEVTLSDIYKYRNICLCYKFNIFVIKNLNLDKQINDKKILRYQKIRQ